MSSNKSLQQNQHSKTCIAAATEILGHKWTPMLLFALSKEQLRFSQLQTEIAGVNPRTLSARLDHLEDAGIITRKTFNEIPPRVEYALTPKGRDLLPIVQAMINWADQHGS